MFRIVGTNAGQALKRSSSSKLVSKNSRFFNSSSFLNLEQQQQVAQQQQPQYFGNDYSNRTFYNNNHNSNNASYKRNYNNHNNNIRNHNQAIAHDNPYRQELLKFDEITNKNYHYDLVKERVVANEYMSSQSFLLNIETVMILYRDLSEAQQIDTQRMSSLVMLLRNGLRFNRLSMKDLEKKPDYDDSQSSNVKIFSVILNSFRSITQDILEGRVEVNSHGFSSIIHLFVDMRLNDEAFNIWEVANSSDHLPNLVLTSRNDQVLGSIFPILSTFVHSYTFEELEALFREAKTDNCHPTLIIGFIRTCLSYNKKDKAIQLFTELSESFYGSSNQSTKQEKFHFKRYISYLTDSHLAFVGYCKDVNTAKVFFDNARTNSMPYPTPLLSNYVNLYMENTWEQTKDIYKVIEIWYQTWENYASKNNFSGVISSSVNGKFLSIFFQKYPTFGEEGFKLLKSLITRYSQIRHLDEPFLNILLVKSSIWRDASVIDSIEAAFRTFNVNKSVVSYRCLLKAYGNTEASATKIYDALLGLLQTKDLSNEKFLSNADWLSFKDATINSTDLDIFNNRDERVQLYFKCLKTYGCYLRNLTYYKRCLVKDSELRRGLFKDYVSNINDLNTNDLQTYNFRYMKRNF